MDSFLSRRAWARTAAPAVTLSAIALLLGFAGCDCASAASTPACAFLCAGDGATCPSGYGCEDGCCRCTSVAEVCDNVDNDCNGLVDDNIVFATNPCTAMGACAAGEGVCSAGTVECSIAPQAETCNGVDDDCDGTVDEDTMLCGSASACGCAPGGAGLGSETCNGMDDDCNGMVDDGLTACACIACGASMGEACNNIDDDCNGMVDEGLMACACAPGGPGPAMETCDNVDNDCNTAVDDGLLNCACSPGGPGPGAEVCNGVDDDCNGLIDDGLMNCACAPGGPGRGAEVCNGIDDDCDGAIDEGTMPCGGTSACACAPGGPGRGAETCNGVDDDCNGMVDDGVPGCACTGCGASGTELCNRIDDDCNGIADDGLSAALCACAPGGPGPSPETCNLRDDDCNGMVNDGLSRTRCACAPGGPGPSAEVCNGVDDNCNGAVDEGLTACACSPGGPGRSGEICNGIDDNCNGAIDEVNSLTGAPCAGFGAPCVRNSDCSSTLCTGDTFDRYCTDTCMVLGDPGDCPMGYRCWLRVGVAVRQECRRNYAPCTSDSSCRAGEVCAITCDDAGTAAVTECRPAIAGGAAHPAACASNRNCSSNDCFRTGFCTAVCATDGDCAPGHRCSLVRVPACGGRTYVGRCLDACDCDTECPAGQLCQAYVHQVAAPATPRVEGACDVSYGAGAPGADCDHTAAPPRTCGHGICSNSGTGFCTQVCSATCACPAPIGPCGPSTVTFSDLGSYAAMTCQTL